MTARGEDILAWLDRAISERETVAREACDGGLGRWHRGWCPEEDLEEGETLGAGVTDERDRTVVYDEGRPNIAQSNHIALNDPASVLRRCAADRKLIAAHGPWTADERALIGEPASDQSCKGCGFNNQEEPMVADYRGCPVLNALAEGYGWTESER